MPDSVHNATLVNFLPSNGHILIEPIQETGEFQPSQRKDEAIARKGRVLAVGGPQLNEFANYMPATAEVGQLVLYRHDFNQPELEANFQKYPVVRFSDILGVVLD